MENEYYLGLDIGTDSVGYAVTDTTYKLKKFKGEPMWGATLFDAANGSEGRRGFRTGRRRLDRRQQRVKLLEDIFAEEIVKIDPSFLFVVKKVLSILRILLAVFTFLKVVAFRMLNITGNIRQFTILLTIL